MTDPTGPPGPDADDAVRRLLRDLPEVTPPEGFFEDLIRSRHRRARSIALVGLAAAGVAGAIVVGQATGITGEADPPMDELADRHEQVIGVEARTLRGEMPAEDVPAPYQAPERVGGMERGMAVRHDDDVVQVVYAADGHYVSVFEEVGDMDDAAMADDLTPAGIDGVDAWWTDDGAVVVRRAEVVYVLMGDMEPDEVAAMVRDLPDARPMGLARRVGDAMDDLVRAFGFG